MAKVSRAFHADSGDLERSIRSIMNTESRRSAMIHASACQLWQPDGQLSPAHTRRSYTTRRGTIGAGRKGFVGCASDKQLEYLPSSRHACVKYRPSKSCRDGKLLGH